MEYVTVGAIINTRGLKGEMKIRSTTDFASRRYQKGSLVFFYHPGTKVQQTFTVSAYQTYQGFDYLTVKEITSIEQAEMYRGYEIRVSVDSLSELPFDVYYHYQLIGCRVINQTGINRGEVIGIDNHGPHDILRIQTKKRVALFPFVKSFLTSVDIDQKIITIQEIEGMFDEDEN